MRDVAAGAAVTGAWAVLPGARAFARSLPYIGAAKPAGIPWPPDAAVLAADPLRPQFHLLPKYGWMNDPNAPTFWRGKYHMFYQYNPGAAVWGDMHWGHAVSADMVHWEHLPVALAPTAASYDADGCFTGSFVNDTALDGGTATIVYTGVQAVSDPSQATLRDGTHNYREVQALATTKDPMLRWWERLPAPVIVVPPPDMNVSGFRDPSVWREGDFFYMTVGSGIRNQGGMVLLYRSPAKGPGALREWEYLHPLAQGEWNGKDTRDAVDSGEMWECPELFRVGRWHVLIYSSERRVFWQTGALDEKTMLFKKAHEGVLDGGNFYAPKTQLDAKGNRILWGWVSESRPDDALKAAGWAGCMSLPRVVGVDDDGMLTMTPAKQVESLRGSPKAGEGWRGGEFHAVLVGADPVLRLMDSEDSTAPWLEVEVRTTDSGRQLRVGEKYVGMPAASEVDLRVFVDASVVEIFANGRACLTVRVYRPVKGTLGAEIDPKSVKRLEVWPMRAISENRLTT